MSVQHCENCYVKQETVLGNSGTVTREMLTAVARHLS